MAQANTKVFYDEEECLGFGVFVAELELIIGTSKRGRLDQTVLLELLQKLQASIISTRDPAVLKQHQKRCEAALYDIIYKGSCAAVRSLVCVCLSSLYTTGDLLPLFSRVNGLQAFLQDKNSTASEAARLSVLGLLAHLELSLGRCLASSALESMAIAVKALAKGNSSPMKAAGLKLAAAVVEGLPQTDRNMAAVQAEAWKLFERQVKDKSSDELRAAAAGLLGSICKADGAVLWGSAGYYAEEALKAAVAALDDAPSQATRESFALALAELAACARSSNPSLVAALDAEKKPAKRQQLEKTASSIFKAALVTPFVEAAVAGLKAVTSALALGWSCYASSLHAPEPEVLVELALKAVAMLELCSKAAAEPAAKGTAPDASHNIGACLAGGEMPAASAAVIYFIRTAIISRLPEPGQRQLLSALATAASHAIAPPVIVAALEGCGVLLEQLGEIHDEAAIKAVQNAATSKLSASSTAVRHQAAAVVAALALSSPPLLAVLFGECLEGVETFCQQLMLLAAPYTKRGPLPSPTSSTSNSTGTGTPRGAPDSQIKHCIDGLHGNALAVGALLVASARSALGAPSRLTSSVFWIAKRMISQPYCSCPWAVAAEREAGYIMLGSMCAAAAPGLLAGRSKQQQVLELFSVALGPMAADALTAAAAAAGDGALDGREAGPGDLELAVSCWWRAAALQALSAYVMGIMGKGLAEDAAQQVRLIAAMLSPLLEAVVANPCLADPVRAVHAAGPTHHTASTPGSSTAASPVHGNAPSPRPTSSSTGASAAAAAAAAGSSSAGGTLGGQAHRALGPVAAAAAALLQLRLLEVFFFLPAAQLWGSCHEQLLQLCCRQALGTGGSAVAPDAAACVAASSLKHMLNSQDALLGPWLPGRDMLEDELRTFVGEPGGPQQHPWEVGAAFTTGFITYSQALLPPDADAADSMSLKASQPAAPGHSPGSGGGNGTNGHLQPLGGTTMRRSTLQQPPGPSALSGPQQQQNVDRLRITRRFMPYPQPYALGPALLEAQMWLLGKLLSVVNTPTLLQVLEVLLGAVSIKPGQPPAQRAANCTAVAMAALAGLVPLARRSRSEGVASDKVAGKVLQLASCMLEDQVYDTCLSRAGAELMAAATCLGSAALAVNQVKAIADQLLAEAGAAASSDGSSGPASSAELRSVLSLVLGCIYRARGGSALQAAVPDAVEALVAVASRPVGVTHIWALHGLWLVAGAAGVAYAAHVKQSLQLALELLVSSYGDHPLLQPAAAQLANAMVAVLGPQFTLGSLAYSRCKTLVTDNTGTLSAALAAANTGGPADSSSSSSLLGASGQPSFAAGADGQRVLAATCSELEQVLFAQQLILFAPDAVSPTKHLPLLLLTLTSSRPTLRKAAAATLWHLADRNAAAFAQECIEAQLLSALDAESEASIASQIRSTLAALLAASAPTRPGYWVRLLGAVVLAAGPAAAAASTQAAVTATAAFRSDTPDEEDEDSQPHQRTNSSSTAAAGASAAAASSSSAAAAGAEAAAVARLPATPRLRTRLFAAELLLSLFAAVGTDERHRHPRPKYENAAGGGAAIAAAAGDADFLVNHLQTLVDLGFKLTTGAAESLRPSGAQLLQQLLRFFGTVPDPDVPELLLLEQYQAQFVSALRAALKPGAAPALAVCGGTLATSFLSAGLAAGDGAVMKRLMDLLVAPLQVWHVLLYGGFAESVGVKARVALLQAHAQCANLAQAFGSDGSSGGGSRNRTASTQEAAAADDVALGIVNPGCFSPNSTINNQLCCSIVIKSQAPYLDMLLLLWWGVLLDYAAFSSTVPGFLDGHKSLLFGHTFPEVVDAVRGTYAAAWPAVLIALASNLPGPQQLAAGSAAAGSRSTTQQQVAPEQQQDAGWSAFVDLVFSGADLTAKGSNSSSSGATSKPGSSAAGPLAAGAADKASSLWHKQLQVQCASIHTNLIDVCLMLLSDAAAACAEALQDCCSSTAAAAAGNASGHGSVLPLPVVGPARRTAISLQALQLLLTQQHLQAGLVKPAVTCDVVKGLTAVAEHVLLPWLQWALASSQQQQPGQQALLDAMASLHVASGTNAAAAAAAAAAGSTGTNACAAAAGDKVFGAVLLAAAQLLLAVTSQAGQQVPGSSGQEAAVVQDAAGGLADQLLEGLLVLSSAAVPFAEPPALNSSSSQGVAADPMRQWVPCLPAFTERSPVQQEVQQGGYAGSSTMETVVLHTCQPSPEAVAACSSLCQAAAYLLQQKQEGTVQAVWHLALRLMLTAAPGPQLQSGHKLLDSCLAACVDIHRAAVQASVQQQQQQQPISGMAATTCKVLCDAVTVAAEQLCSTSSSSQASVLPDASARLPVLISGLLQAASACTSCSDSPACAAAVERSCGVLLWCLQLHSPEGNRPSGTVTASTGGDLNSSHGEAGPGLLVCRVLEGLRQLLQNAVGLLGQQPPLGKAQFAQQCAAAVIPQVAGLIHGAMCSGRGPLTGHDFTAVAEGLKVLLLLSTCMASKGEAAQAAVLQVLVPLLIEVAKPPSGTPATPLLRSMACKLVSAMPTSAAAAAFRVVVTALPTSSKERLQVALRENAAEQAAGSAAIATQSTDRAASKKPAIQLKMNFQLPVPKP